MVGIRKAFEVYLRGSIDQYFVWATTDRDPSWTRVVEPSAPYPPRQIRRDENDEPIWGVAFDWDIDGRPEDGEGGGLYVYYDGVVQNTRITGNSASGNGGGAVLRYGPGEYPGAWLKNCTVADNSAGVEGGGVHFHFSGRVQNSSTVRRQGIDIQLKMSEGCIRRSRIMRVGQQRVSVYAALVYYRALH